MVRTLALSLALTASAFLGAAEGAWLTDAAKAKAEAAKSGKPILMDFTGSDWCGWCVKLKKEVFDTPEFTAWAKDKVVLLEVDFPRKKEQSAEAKKVNRELSETYKIEGYPTIIIADAAGKELGRLGYQQGGPASWTAAADKFIPAKK